MDKIEWMQVLIAFFLGVLSATSVKAFLSHLRSQASSAIG